MLVDRVAHLEARENYYVERVGGEREEAYERQRHYIPHVVEMLKFGFHCLHSPSAAVVFPSRTHTRKENARYSVRVCVCSFLVVVVVVVVVK